MRKVMCVLGLMMVLVVAQAHNYCICVSFDCFPTAPGLMAYWQFNTSSGSLVFDDTGNGNNGNLDGATRTTDAISGLALSFDGNDAISVGSGTFGIDTSNAFSVSLWFKFPANFSGYFFKRGDYIYPFQLYNYNSRLGTGIRTSSGTNYLASSTILTANTWYHAVLTYRSGERRLYLNGQLNAANAHTGTPALGENSTTVIGEGFTGIIDEVRIYNRVLSTTEVSDLYNYTKNRITQVAAGYNYSVALKNDGTVVAWGGNELGQCTVPAGLSGVKTIAAAAGSHTLALKGDGTVTAWGDNNVGQCNVPGSLKGVKAIAAGWSHSVALRHDGTVAAWGDNSWGQCTIPAGATGVVAVAAGYLHTVALLSDGTVIAWGNNDDGQCNVPAGLDDVKAISAAAYCTLALLCDGTVVAWGDNSNWQCDIPAGLNGVAAITVGASFCVALKQDGTVVAWGDNSDWQLNVPAGFNGAIAIAAGGVHTLALKKDGTVDTWGFDYTGQCNVPIAFN